MPLQEFEDVAGLTLWPLCCRYGRASHMRVRVLGEATFLRGAGLLEVFVLLS